MEEEGEKEEEEGRKRVRHIYTQKQTLHLEYIFRTEIYPDTYIRNKLAVELGISPQKVQVRSGLYQERVEEEGEKEEEEGRKRVRHVYTRKQTLHLEYIFRTHIYPDTYTRNKLAVELGISPQKVQVRYIRNKLAVELGISPQKVLVRYIRNKLTVELGISPQKVQVRSGLYQERVEEEGEKEEEEEEEGRKRVRHVYTRKQTLHLEYIFRTHIYPDTYTRNKLAVELGISPQKVQVRYIRNKLAVELGISPQKVLVRYIRNKLAVELGISPQKVQVRSGLYQERVEEEGEKEEEEEEEGRKRIRHVYTRKQTLHLEYIFRTHIYPDTYTRNKLAVELGISPQKVQVRYIRNKLAVELGISPQKVQVRMCIYVCVVVYVLVDVWVDMHVCVSALMNCILLGMGQQMTHSTMK